MAYGHAERNLAFIRQLEAETRNLLDQVAALDREQSTGPGIHDNGLRLKRPDGLIKADDLYQARALLEEALAEPDVERRHGSPARSQVTGARG